MPTTMIKCRTYAAGRFYLFCFTFEASVEEFCRSGSVLDLDRSAVHVSVHLVPKTFLCKYSVVYPDAD